MIPNHKCSPYCEPDDGIHCLPDTWFPGKKIADFNRAYNWTKRWNLELIRVREEADVTLNTCRGVILEHDLDWQAAAELPQNKYVGYLIWVKDNAD